MRLTQRAVAWTLRRLRRAAEWLLPYRWLEALRDLWLGLRPRHAEQLRMVDEDTVRSLRRNRHPVTHQAIGRKVFIDCGTNYGQGLESFRAAFRMDRSWRIVAFEPNPAIFAQLLHQTYARSSVELRNVAVSDEDSVRTFYLSSDASGSSLSKDFADLAGATWNKYLDGHLGPITTRESADYRTYGASTAPHAVEVTCVDLSRILAEEIGPDDYVVMKLDIEGAEYRVLRGLIRGGMSSKIDRLYVEFHERFMPDESPATNEELRRAFAGAGVLVFDWS